ncbi:ariadne RING finger [Dothidotthia symphoricarpi CBS 119687]|uniref:RBR-type E3 ubiquitin transferase n=1 Tax=Dothidotthia symphoricarpi CBS 119687 TaxID=1392245 RepID=A0A6A6ATR8_9PLEO|nr:ariadne RING finger [Dothidotthia symphoricarpi CBS 119687]KAF2134354.1 ariadne RING finger [Dothidotthia symphoricarpi CBS 119687]
MASTVAANSVIEFSDDESEAGPSMGFAERQAETIKKLSAEFQCSACTDRFPRAHMITAKCSHRYCTACIKHLFMRSTNDESLYPPRCCKQEIPLALVSKHMNPEELATFQLARVEHATVNKTYCSDHACGEFIIPDNIEPGTHRATCTKCGTTTCSICKNGVHAGDCPDDESLRQTREMARVLGWQACYSCNRVVQLRSGCNHITCRCRAEFCYVCGAAWKTCACANADINRIEERAEEVVDRDAPRYLPPAERRARVDQVFADLQENHECTHSRRFQRLTNAPRRGYRCELCDAQHYKYILQCRQCYVNVCEECRRNRI